MGNVPTSLFVLAVRDDAMAPEYPVGTLIVWNAADRVPRIDKPLLLRHRGHADHARVAHQGKAPGSWTAPSYRKAFPSFDPVVDDLEILAVYWGTLDPR